MHRRSVPAFNPPVRGSTACESDTETGMYYYRARYYDPNPGRFLTEDPITFQGGNNFYTYVHNTPTTFTDPFGLLDLDPSCSCRGGWKKPNLQLASQLAEAGASRITDTRLRDCILSKLNNGTVKCGGKECDKHAKPDKNGKVWAGWAPILGRTIHLCKAGIDSGNDLSIACTMIHEFGHTCAHHPGEGTPNRAANQAFPGLCPQ